MAEPRRRLCIGQRTSPGVNRWLALLRIEDTPPDTTMLKSVGSYAEAVERAAANRCHDLVFDEEVLAEMTAAGVGP